MSYSREEYDAVFPDDFENSYGPYDDYQGDEVNDDTLDPLECARCAVEYVAANIPGMVRCPKCGDYVDLDEEDAHEGLWEQSSRHRTRLDREDDGE